MAKIMSAGTQPVLAPWSPAPAQLTIAYSVCRGITRANVIRLCRAHGIPVFEKNFSLTEVYGAQEAFVTGTFAGVVPACEIDGRTMGDGKRGPMVARLQQLERLAKENGNMA